VNKFGGGATAELPLAAVAAIFQNGRHSRQLAAQAGISHGNIALIYDRIAKIFASCRKSGSRNTMVTSDFRQKVEIRPDITKIALRHITAMFNNHNINHNRPIYM